MLLRAVLKDLTAVKVVDMRWGVRDEATDDHMTTDLCMNEIDNCQRLSIGPNFCVSRRISLYISAIRSSALY